MCSPDLLLVLFEAMSLCLDGYAEYRNLLCDKIDEIRIRSTSLTTDRLFQSSSFDSAARENSAEVGNAMTDVECDEHEDK